MRETSIYLAVVIFRIFYVCYLIFIAMKQYPHFTEEENEAQRSWVY